MSDARKRIEEDARNTFRDVIFCASLVVLGLGIADPIAWGAHGVPYGLMSSTGQWLVLVSGATVLKLVVRG